GVESVILVVAVGPASPGGHQGQHDDLVVAPDHREDRRFLEEIAADREAELVSIILRGADDVGDEEERGDPGHSRYDATSACLAALCRADRSGWASANGAGPSCAIAMSPASTGASAFECVRSHRVFSAVAEIRAK